MDEVDFPASIETFVPGLVSDSFPDWELEMEKAKQFKALVERSDSLTKQRYARFRRQGQGVLSSAKRALEMKSEDREAKRLPGPLVLVDGKVRYRPFPGERSFPGDLERD